MLTLEDLFSKSPQEKHLNFVMSSTASTAPAKDETVTATKAVADSTEKTDSVLRYVNAPRVRGDPIFFFELCRGAHTLSLAPLLAPLLSPPDRLYPLDVV